MSNGACDRQLDEGLWRQSDSLSTRAAIAFDARANAISGYGQTRVLGEPKATVDVPNMRAWEMRSAAAGVWPGDVERTICAPYAIDDDATPRFFQTHTKARGYVVNDQRPNM
jgi:hypothetical protein